MLNVARCVVKHIAVAVYDAADAVTRECLVHIRTLSYLLVHTERLRLVRATGECFHTLLVRDAPRTYTAYVVELRYPVRLSELGQILFAERARVAHARRTRRVQLHLDDVARIAGVAIIVDRDRMRSMMINEYVARSVYRLLHRSRIIFGEEEVFM